MRKAPPFQSLRRQYSYGRCEGVSSQCSVSRGQRACNEKPRPLEIFVTLAGKTTPGQRGNAVLPLDFSKYSSFQANKAGREKFDDNDPSGPSPFAATIAFLGTR
jgi:hypothetical protein